MMRTLSLTLLVLLAFIPRIQAQGPADAAVVLRPGDAVRLTVWRNPELSGEFAVAEDGTLAHPLLRDVQVTNVPLATVDARIRDRLERLESSPQFVIQPLLSVAIGGEVRQPGLLRLPPVTSISEAVALAGGATERGRLQRVRLVRGSQVLHMDLLSPEAGWAQRPIHSGDQLFVERRASIFRDYIAPAGSITAALVSLISALTR